MTAAVAWDLPDHVFTNRDRAEFAAVADILSPPVDPYTDDPVGWIERHTFIWSKQKEICEAVRDHRFTAVRSCHGSGKSYIAAWIICWWLATHEDAMVVTSAPSQNQVKNILWKEINRAKEKVGLPGYITRSEIPEWKDDSGEVVAWGRKPADYADPDKAMTAFQGVHAKHVLVLLDEGSGIPDWLATAAENLVTNEHSRVLIIGNPDNPSSYFARMSKPASGYHRIRIRAWDLPAYTDEYVPEEVADVLTGKLWVEERRKRWGEGSMFWTSKVEAEFPDVAEDILFTPAILARGIRTDLSSNAATKRRGTGGLDVARMGQDETVMYVNKYGYVRIKDRWGKLDTMQTVERFCSHYPDNNPGAAPTYHIDVTGGLGAGPYDRLKQLGYPVLEFNFGGGPLDKTRFKNRRAEAYYEAMEACQDGRVDLDELDEELQRELMEHRYKTNSTGLIQIEAKEDVAKRLGRSPDRADAFVMALQSAADWQRALNAGVYERTGVDDRPKDREPSAEELVADIMDVKF
jgi:hypothetical protein